MPKCIAIGFEQDIIRSSLDYASDRCVMIFPTQVNVRRAKYLFQARWQLEDLCFYSMEEYKQSLIRSRHPLLQEDKRLLCLYQALSTADRSFYHIDSYDDLVGWGCNWFKLMQELREECFDIERLRDPEDLAELYLRDWQIKSIPRIMAIRDQYQRLINDKGFDDLIFIPLEQSIDPDPRYNRYVFVNQYYYTALEKQTIRKLEEIGYEVIIMYQGLENWFDPETMRSSDFDLEGAIREGNHLLKSINIVQTGSKAEQYLQFLSDAASLIPGIIEHGAVLAKNSITDPDTGQLRQKRAIIDRSFQHSAQAALFDPIRFGMPHSFPITHTRLFQTLMTITQTLEHLTSDESATYLPIKDIAALVADAGLCSMWNMSDMDRDQIQRLLAQLSAENVLYLDLEGAFFAIREQTLSNTQAGKIDLRPLQDYMTKVAEIIQSIVSVTSLTALIDVLDSDLLPMALLCTEDELAYTDILDKIPERLANALSIETIGIVQNWQDFFPNRKNCLAADLMNLLTQIVKSAYISYRVTDHDLPIYDITDIQDSRNLCYDQTVFFNVMEGEYPTNPSPVWLFSENQRVRMGLISWEEVRKRERYYFFRLLLGSCKAVLYCYSDKDKGVEQSSFIGEILVLMRNWQTSQDAPDHLPEIKVLPMDHTSPLIRDLFNSRFINLRKVDLDVGADSDPFLENDSLYNQCSFDHRPEALLSASGWIRRICSIPYDPSDFGKNHTVALSYHKLAAFANDPFMWFVEHHCGISSRQTDAPPQISRGFFGNILHEYLRTIMERVVAEYDGKLKDKWQWYNEGFLLKTLTKLLSLPEYDFKLPQNYNHEFIREVIIPTLIRAARDFLHDILPHLPIKSMAEVTIIPEEPYNADNPLQYKQFIPPSEETEGTAVIIRCIADLRVESPDEAVIIDFKTGSSTDKDQLVMYYWYYYVLNEDYNRKVTGMFINPLGGHPDSCEMSAKRRDALYTKVKDALVSIINTGYGTARTRKLRDRNYQITRADLNVLPGGDDENDD